MLPTGFYCKAEGCSRRPSEGKPFCATHVAHMPYAQFLIEQHATRQSEIDRILDGRVGTLDMASSLVVRWILNALHINGPLTVERAAKETGIPPKAVKICIRRMLKEGMLEEREFYRDTCDMTKKLIPLVAPSSEEVAELAGARTDDT